MKVNHIIRKVFLMATAALVSVNTLAATCLPDYSTKEKPLVAEAGTRRITTSQQGEWEDWIWQGPIFYCSGGEGAGDCSYAWGQEKTTSYAWATGVQMTLGAIPAISKTVGELAVNASFTRTISWAERFTWTQTIKPGYFARPVQIVGRRWSSGHFLGGWRKTNKGCDGDSGWFYNWDSTAKFGSWGAHMENRRWKKYHIWKQGT